MTIECNHCGEKTPEWETREGCCLPCWEQHERDSEHFNGMDNQENPDE